MNSFFFETPGSTSTNYEIAYMEIELSYGSIYVLSIVFIVSTIPYNAKINVKIRVV